MDWGLLLGKVAAALVEILAPVIAAGIVYLIVLVAQKLHLNLSSDQIEALKQKILDIIAAVEEASHRQLAATGQPMTSVQKADLAKKLILERIPVGLQEAARLLVDPMLQRWRNGLAILNAK